jgi:hypothetical protein
VELEDRVGRGPAGGDVLGLAHRLRRALSTR